MAEKTPKIESRQFPRYEVNARVDVTGSQDVLLFHSIQNLSLGGICIQSPTVEELGTIIDLVLNFPDGQSVALQGEVVWVNHEPPMDMGIRYIDIDESRREIIRRHLGAGK